jgi:polyisoprenoid-binding protein YceI
MIRWHRLAGTIGIMAICMAACAAAQEDPPRLAGRWDGTIDVPGLALPFSVTFAAPSGAITGTIDVKAHKASPLQAIQLTGHTIHFELQAAKPAAAVFDGTIDRDSIRGTFTQGRARGTFSLALVDAAAAAAASVPYRSEDVTFANGSVTLAGTLTMPQGNGPFRALVMLTGTGAQNRDEELFGFKIFATIADHLTRHGIAVLRYDDRGIGGVSVQEGGRGDSRRCACRRLAGRGARSARGTVRRAVG